MSISSSFLHDKAIMIEFICIMKKQVYNTVTYPQKKKFTIQYNGIGGLKICSPVDLV